MCKKEKLLLFTSDIQTILLAFRYRFNVSLQIVSRYTFSKWPIFLCCFCCCQWACSCVCAVLILLSSFIWIWWWIFSFSSGVSDTPVMVCDLIPSVSGNPALHRYTYTLWHFTGILCVVNLKREKAITFVHIVLLKWKSVTEM